MNGPEALRWAADQMISDCRLFDSDHDNALVAARLTELADRIDGQEKRLDLSQDDATLILNALSAYRWVLLGRTGKDDGRITDLSARIIWRGEAAS